MYHDRLRHLFLPSVQRINHQRQRIHGKLVPVRRHFLLLLPGLTLEHGTGHGHGIKVGNQRQGVVGKVEREEEAVNKHN